MIQLSELLRGVGQRAAESLDNTWRPEEAGARAQRENTTSGGVFGDWAQERYGDAGTQSMASIPENPSPAVDNQVDWGQYPVPFANLAESPFASIPNNIVSSLWVTAPPTAAAGPTSLWDTGRTPKLWGPEAKTTAAAAAGSFGFGNGANYGAASGNDNVANFMNRLRPAAQRVSAETGIPYEVLMAIPANETGWGSAIAGNNLYGIKGTSKSGKNTGAVGTWEVVDGQRVNINDTFRAYDSDEESMRDFASFLKENPRYGDALQQFQQTGDADALVRNIGAAGYATDPEWGNKITNIMGTVRERSQVAQGIQQQAAANTPGGMAEVQNQITLANTDPKYAQDALSICGPVAYMWFAQTIGRRPSLQEAMELAGVFNYSRDGGMNGFGNFTNMLRSQGIQGQEGPYDDASVRQAVTAGKPVVISSGAHYWTLQPGQVDENGRYYVGESGNVLGGSKWLSLNEMDEASRRLGKGGLNGAFYGR